MIRVVVMKTGRERKQKQDKSIEIRLLGRFNLVLGHSTAFIFIQKMHIYNLGFRPCLFRIPGKKTNIQTSFFSLKNYTEFSL